MEVRRVKNRATHRVAQIADFLCCRCRSWCRCYRSCFRHACFARYFSFYCSFCFGFRSCFCCCFGCCLRCCFSHNCFFRTAWTAFFRCCNLGFSFSCGFRFRRYLGFCFCFLGCCSGFFSVSYGEFFRFGVSFLSFSGCLLLVGCLFSAIAFFQLCFERFDLLLEHRHRYFLNCLLFCCCHK